MWFQFSTSRWQHSYFFNCVLCFQFFPSVCDIINHYSHSPLVLIDAKNRTSSHQNQCLLSDPAGYYMTGQNWSWQTDPVWGSVSRQTQRENFNECSLQTTQSDEWKMLHLCTCCFFFCTFYISNLKEYLCWNISVQRRKLMSDLLHVDPKNKL